MKRLYILAFICISIFSFVGCDNREDIKKVDLNKREEIKNDQEPL